MTTTTYRPTLEDALAWEATPEKWIFCADQLEVSAHAATTNDKVDALEERYTAKLATYRSQMTALATRCSIACQILGERAGSLWALTFTTEGKRIFEIMEKARSLAIDAQHAALDASGTE